MKLEKLYGDVENNNGEWNWLDVVEWIPELQKLADRDEPIKVDLCTCPSCGEGDAIYDSWDNKNNFCGNCGQRLNWGE